MNVKIIWVRMIKGKTILGKTIKNEWPQNGEATEKKYATRRLGKNCECQNIESNFPAE